MKFGIPLDEVEEMSIGDYRLCLFTAINTAALESGMGEFKHMTEDEEVRDFEEDIEYFRKRGVREGVDYFKEKGVN